MTKLEVEAFSASLFTTAFGVMGLVWTAFAEGIFDGSMPGTLFFMISAAGVYAATMLRRQAVLRDEIEEFQRQSTDRATPPSA